MAVLVVLFWVLWIQGRSGLRRWARSWPSRLRARTPVKTAGMP
jgi:hypothetical protein